jgi:hypothetical protein
VLPPGRRPRRGRAGGPRPDHARAAPDQRRGPRPGRAPPPARRGPARPRSSPRGRRRARRRRGGGRSRPRGRRGAGRVRRGGRRPGRRPPRRPRHGDAELRCEGIADGRGELHRPGVHDQDGPQHLRTEPLPRPRHLRRGRLDGDGPVAVPGDEPTASITFPRPVLDHIRRAAGIAGARSRSRVRVRGDQPTGVRRHRHRRQAHQTRCRHRRDPPQGQTSAARREIERQCSFRSGGWSSGARAPRAASPVSNAATGWMDRTHIDGIHGARTWVGHGVLTHNLVHLAAIASPRTPGRPRQPPQPKPLAQLAPLPPRDEAISSAEGSSGRSR